MIATLLIHAAIATLGVIAAIVVLGAILNRPPRGRR